LNQLLANIFLVCFLVGLIMTVVSLLFGADHHLHIGDHGGGFSSDVGGDVGDAGGDAGADHGSGHHVPFFSYQGILMFITWFGGVGFILHRHAGATVLVVIMGALVAGFIGAGVVFIFMAKFLIPSQTEMNPRDYYLPGTLARVCTTIRPGRTGEIIYVQGGARKTLGARSEEGLGHKQGEEVVIMRYEKGIAYVKSVADELERA
jgi:hypothetical protein